MLSDVRSHRVSPVFVGRTSEITQLTQGLARAREGEPQAFVLGGEAGVGKTRVVEEFTATARASGVVAAVGGCVELGADGLPFAPIAAVLRSLHRQLGPALRQAAAGQEDELARLLPELGESGHAPPGEVDRAGLFEFTTRLLERLADEQPLLVVIEDLHWSDRSTRELLGYLYRSLQRSRLLVLATYRTDDIHRRHPLRPFLAELDRLRSVRRIELSRFTQAEVTAQMAGIQGTPPEPALARSVFTRSEGNPFFVEELIAGDTSGDISESLRDLLLVRVEALPEHTQEVLRIVAEGGSSVEHGLLAAVARCTENELLTALRTAVGGNLLVPTEDGDGYRFRHALMREAVIDDLLPGERARLNRRYARALEESGHLVPSDQLAARTASYWYLAGEPAKALPAVLDAAVQARRRYAFAEQLRLLERALELWDGTPKDVRLGLRPVDHIESFPVPATGQPLRFRELLAEAMHAANLSGQPDRGWVIGKQALRLLDEVEDPLLASWFWVHRSRVREQLGRGDGLPELVRAQELITGLPPSVGHAYVLAATASWQTVHRPGPESFGYAERALEMARVVGAESIELHARFTLASLKTDSGDVEGGIAEMRAVRDQLLRQNTTPTISGIGRVMVNFAASLGRFGRLAESRKAAEEGLELCDRLGLGETKPWLQTNLGAILEAQGDWDGADRAFGYAAQHGTEPRAKGSTLAHLGLLRLRRGDLAGAERSHTESRKLLDAPEVQIQFRLPGAWLAMDLAATGGRIVEAREEFGHATEGELPPFMATMLWRLVPVATAIEADARGRPEAAAGRAEALRRIAKVANRLPTVLPVWASCELHWRAELSRAEGCSDPAAWQAAAAACAALAEVPVPMLATIRYRWAEALVGSGGSRAQAEEVLREARTTVVRLGAEPLRADIDQLAKRARLDLTGSTRATADPAGAPDLAGSLGLTARERDVLALVAAGRSNRQIAEELYIAPKTASVHVSNILAKLEVSSRGEAAALAHRLRLVPVGND
jgi:ATP/maltotriose-dependent transcriptional regulator MalT